MRAVVIVHRQSNLLQIVQALGPPRRFPRRLNGGQQQGDQDADDGDHHQQLDQREGTRDARRGNATHGNAPVLMDWVTDDNDRVSRRPAQNRKHWSQA